MNSCSPSYPAWTKALSPKPSRRFTSCLRNKRDVTFFNFGSVLELRGICADAEGLLRLVGQTCRQKPESQPGSKTADPWYRSTVPRAFDRRSRGSSQGGNRSRRPVQSRSRGPAEGQPSHRAPDCGADRSDSYAFANESQAENGADGAAVARATAATSYAWPRFAGRIANAEMIRGPLPMVAAQKNKPRRSSQPG